MPTYEVETPTGTYEVDSDRELSDEEVVGALAEQGVELPHEAEADADTRGWLAKAIPLGIRVVGGAISGSIGAIPSPLTTPLAASAGALEESAAQAVEIAQGVRKGFNPKLIGVEAALSAVPLGRAAKGAGVVRHLVTEGAKMAGVEAVGAQARSLAERGEFASAGETAAAAALGGGLGVAGAGLGRLVGRGATETAEEVAHPLEQAAADIGEKAGAAPREAVQLGLFDDAGRVRPELGPIVEGPSAKAGAALIDAVAAEGDEAARILAATEAAEEGKRLYLQVAEGFEKGQFDAPGLVQELAEKGLSMPEFIRQHYAPGVQRAGRILQQLSALRQHLDTLADPESIEALNELSKVVPKNKFWAFLQKLDDTRRGLLVSQLKTGVRNAVSQGAAYGTDLVDQAVNQAIGGQGDFFGHVGAFLRAMKGKESAAGVEKMLKGRSDLARKLGVYEYTPGGSFIQDVPVLRSTVGKFTDATTWVNRFQEEFFRRAKFDAVVRQGLKRAGINVEEALADPRLIPGDLLETAVEDALQLTFAGANPGGLRRVIAGAQLTRPISTLFVAFPRYTANAMTYVAKRNPLGLVRLATKYGRANADKVLSEAATGTMLLSGALALRAANGGEKWYELNGPDGRRLDMRGFAGPFAPYLFMADAILQTAENGRVNYTGQDIADGVLGVSRLAGTTSSILSFLTEKVDSPAAFNKYIARIAGDWLGGFATPAKTVRDAMVIAGQAEPVLRDTREHPFLGATMAALPGVEATLPARQSITTGEDIRIEDPTLGALTGLSTRKPNAIEAEMNRLNVAPMDVAPQGTGIPEADRELTRRTGRVMSVLGNRAVETAAYQRLSDAEKIIAVKGLFKKAREVAREMLKESDPRLFAVVRTSDKLDQDTRRVLRERGVDVEGIFAKVLAGRGAEPEAAPEAAPAPEPEAEPQAAGPATPYDDFFAEAATATGVPLAFLKASGYKETRFRNILGSKTEYGQAHGPMQILPTTFRALAPEVQAITGRKPNIDDPRDNILASALYYKQLLAQSGGDPAGAARLYHGGPNLRLHGKKTKAYGDAVARLYRTYAEGD